MFSTGFDKINMLSKDFHYIRLFTKDYDLSY